MQIGGRYSREGPPSQGARARSAPVKDITNFMKELRQLGLETRPVLFPVLRHESKEFKAGYGE